MHQQAAAPSRSPAAARSPGLRQVYLALSERELEAGAASAAAGWLRTQLDGLDPSAAALPQGAEQFLPELIGYNLGYEQLPLHLLITAYELNELGIAPYYFTLHVTVDNADTGHARKADAVPAPSSLRR